ncbi:MAG: hypothetical protein KJO41_11085 [Bacteroidia bacterium]|nr:hypothetical protein [Bacteroidia bacterium]NND26038.1 hypothetical protein [Flavobacteriaceae bacterium]NNL33576.1 hypothetical protein [Flavobacteriaceae bacterium]
MNNTGIIITLAFPETIVKVSDEWFISLIRYMGIGKKNYVRAGHAAIVLADTEGSQLEYYDFGRYIAPDNHGRVRSKETDHELEFPIRPIFQNNTLVNLNEILTFLATSPKFTHGQGKLIASVCDEIDYKKAKNYIIDLQNRDFVKYAVFKKNASNCARFVTDTLIAGTTNKKIKKRLKRSKWFTPSTVGNVVLSNTKNRIYEISETGDIGEFKSTVTKENTKNFLDRLRVFQPDAVGTIHPKPLKEISSHAQWIGGVGAGAWFELHDTAENYMYRFKRISPHGSIDVNGLYKIDDEEFHYDSEYEFIHYSNCQFFHIKQGEKIFRFDLLKKLN